jgi:nickel transport protein
MIWTRTRQDRFYPALAIILALFIFISLPGSAIAHRVIVYAWVDGDTVYVESKFNSGRKVKNGRVSVIDSQGAELLSGVTDENGEFSFSIPQKTALKIILDAGGGHRGEWRIPLEEIEAITSQSGNLDPQTHQHPESGVESAQTITRSDDTSVPAPSFAQIELAVEKALDKKLKPIIKMLAQTQQKGPTAKDIFAGIGYIVGLVGLAAYMRSRKKE